MGPDAFSPGTGNSSGRDGVKAGREGGQGERGGGDLSGLQMNFQISMCKVTTQ